MRRYVCPFIEKIDSVHSVVPPAASNNPHGVCAFGYDPSGTKRPGKFGPDQSEFA